MKRLMQRIASLMAFAMAAILVASCGSSAAPTATPAVSRPTATPVTSGGTPSTAAATPTNTPIPIVTGRSPLGAEYDYTKHPMQGAKYGGTFVTFIERGPGSCTVGWQPARGRVTNNTCNGHFNAVVRTGPGDVLLPDLAESWDVSADGKTYTFKLRRGVKFHDGTDVNAEAVVYNLKRLIDAPAGTRKPEIFTDAGVTAVRKIDDYTVAVKLVGPFAEFMMDFATSITNIGCPNSYDKLIEEGKPPLFIDFMTSCGSGAFKPKSFVEESTYESVKNPDYWHKGLPYLDAMKVLVIPDASTRLAAIVTGNADMYQATEMLPQDRQGIESSARFKRGDIKTYEYPVGLRQAAHINMQAPITKDKRVRQAMLLALNVEEAHRVLNFGQGTWEGLIMPKSSGWALSDEEMRAYPGMGTNAEADVAKAKQLLAEAGFPNGFKARPIQQRVTPKAVANMTFVVNRLKLVGIDIEGRAVDAGVAQIYSDNHDYEIDAGYDGSNWLIGQLMGQFLCTGRPTCNRTMYSNTEYEAMFEKQRSTLDPVERKKIVDAMQRMVLNEYIYTVTAWSVRNIAYQSYVKNYDPTAQGQQFLHATRYETIWLAK